MRDPQRIGPLTDKIARLWGYVPDWRLGQLVDNAISAAGYADTFHAEDDILERGLDELIRRVDNG